MYNYSGCLSLEVFILVRRFSVKLDWWAMTISASGYVQVLAWRRGRYGNSAIKLEKYIDLLVCNRVCWEV